MSKTGFVYNENYLTHLTGLGHPERPERLEAIINFLENNGLLKKLIRIEPVKADIEWIRKIHTQQYIDHVVAACKNGDMFLDSMDTGICKNSYEVALLAVGGCLKAADAVMAGIVSNVFCAVRPPGHHAEKDQAMGFCIFNNVAILTRYLQKRHAIKKILIIDWDVHHGNGTQNAFYNDDSVFYFSIHQFPHYPGTGSESEKGNGLGKDYTRNVPASTAYGDKYYLKVFEEILKPAALRFNPDFVLISAGFDAHLSDPLSGINVSETGFDGITRIVKEISNQCSRGRIVSVLEGGYDLNALARSVSTHILALME